MFRALVFVAVLALLGLGGGALQLREIWLQPMTLPQGGATVTISRGESLQQVLRRAQDQQWISHAKWIGWIARWHGMDEQVKAGEYQLDTPLSASELIQMLAIGAVKQYTVTLPEGITLTAAIALLQAHPKITSTPAVQLEADLLELVGRDDSAEGLFLPETWAFNHGDSEFDVLRRAHRALNELLTELWERRPSDSPLDSPYAALTLASIVEKETGVASERPQIAGVFLRRLTMGMRLQTDPTVIYGLGEDYEGDLKRRHLRDTGNRYNTYAIAGLPPTPIALAGEAALRAVFAPDDSESLYFVAKGDGSHAFSASLTEHEENVRRYQLTRREDYRSSPSQPDASSK